MKRIWIGFLVLCLLLPGLAHTESDGMLSILVSAYGFGPGVSGVILQMDQSVSIAEVQELSVTVGGTERDIVSVSPCDEQGKLTQGPSDRLLIALSEQNAMRSPLFETDPATGWRDWVKACEVSVEGTLTLDGDEKQITLCPNDSAGGL